MKNTTDAIKTLIDSGIPVYTRARVRFFDSNGDQVLSRILTPEEFRMTGNSYTQTSGNMFPVGMALSKSITITISNLYNEWGEYDWNNSTITLYSCIYPNGTSSNFNTLREGTFYTSQVKYVQNAIEITAYDMISLLNYPFVISNVNPSQGTIIYPTVWDYFVYLCDEVLADKMGVTLTGSQHMYASHLNTDRFMNSTFQLDYIAAGEATHTLRDVFAYIGQIAGGNIVLSYDSASTRDVIDIVPFKLEHTEYTLYNGMQFGDIVSNTFDGGEFGEIVANTLTNGEFDDSDYVLLDKYTSAPTMEYNDVVYTGVSINFPLFGGGNDSVVSSLSNVNMLNLENPLYQIPPNSPTDKARVQTCADNVCNVLCNKPVRPFSGRFSNNPLIEFMDNVIVIDAMGEAYNSFITDHTFNYLGVSEISNEIPTQSQNNSVFFR